MSPSQPTARPSRLKLSELWEGARRTLPIALMLFACAEPLPPRGAEVQLELLARPPLGAERLSTWERPEQGSSSLWLTTLGEERGAQAGWRRLSQELTQDPTPLSADEGEGAYQAEALWRSLTAVELPLHMLSLEGLDGGWLHEALSASRAAELTQRAEGEELSGLLYPLPGLDYRAREIPVGDVRRLRVTLSPWSLLPWALEGHRPSRGLELNAALTPLLERLSSHALGWSSLAEQLSLSGPWSLPLLIAQLSERAELEALARLARELALHSLLRREGPSAEQERWLRALPCLFEQLKEPAELARVVEAARRDQLDSDCSLPLDQVWVRLTQERPSLSGAHLSLSAQAHGFTDRSPPSPLSLRVERLSYVPSELLRRASLTQEEVEGLQALIIGPEEGCDVGEGGRSCLISWRDAARGKVSLLFTVLDGERSDPNSSILGGRAAEYELTALPTWTLTFGALSRPRVTSGPQGLTRPAPLLVFELLSAGRAALEPSAPLSLNLNEAGLGSQAREGSASSLWVSSLTEADLAPGESLSLWSPFPAPGRWRSPRSGERLEALIGPRALLSDDMIEGLEAPSMSASALQLISPLQAKVSEALNAERSPLLPVPTELIERSEQLSASLLSLMGGALSPLRSASLPARLEALAVDPEALAELLGSGGAQGQEWSTDELAQLRAWLCFEAASALSPSEPSLLSPLEVSAGEPPHPSPEWLEWLSLGCLIGALSWGDPARPARYERLTEPEALEALLSSREGDGALPRWVEELLERLSSQEGALSAQRLTVSLDGGDGSLERLGALEGELTELTEPLTERPLIIQLTSPAGLSALSLRYLEAPWLTEGAELEPPAPFYSARLLDEEALTALDPLASSGPCLWRRPPLSQLSAAWRLDAAWRSTHPLTDPRWLVSRTQGASPYLSACHASFQLDSAALPEGDYLVALELEPTWGAPHTRRLRFSVDRSPLEATLEPSEGLSLIAQRRSSIDGAEHSHAHLLLSDLSLGLSRPEAPTLAMIELNRAARCALSSAPSLSALPPLRPARFLPEERPVEELSLQSSAPQEAMATAWLISARPAEEGSARYAVSCEDHRGEFTSVTLDLTADVSPPRLHALWLIQAQEAELSALRLGPDEGPAPSAAWLLFSDDRVSELLDERLPSATIDRTEGGAASDEEAITRWRGWWGAAQCSDEPPRRCLLSEEGPCEGAVADRCLARELPLTLHALLSDEQWEPEALSLGLSATLSAPDSPPRAYADWRAHTARVDELREVSVALREPWALGLWEEPALLEPSLLSLRPSSLSPAFPAPRSPLLLNPLPLRSLTPPPLLSISAEELPADSILTELSLLTQPELIELRAFNPHVSPLWLRLSSPGEALQLSAELDRAAHGALLGQVLSERAREGCLWDSELGQPRDELFISSFNLSVETLTESSCSLVQVPRSQRFEWSAWLGWSPEPDVINAGAGWYELGPGEELTLSLQASWEHPPFVYAVLSQLVSLPPPREGEYVFPGPFSGIFWGEAPCPSCPPPLIVGTPYRRLRELSVAYEGGEPEGLSWSLHVSSPEGGEAVAPLPPRLIGALPSALRYELADP